MLLVKKTYFDDTSNVTGRKKQKVHELS